jgi:hypothetical protein
MAKRKKQSSKVQRNDQKSKRETVRQHTLLEGRRRRSQGLPKLSLNARQRGKSRGLSLQQSKVSLLSIPLGSDMDLGIDLASRIVAHENQLRLVYPSKMLNLPEVTILCEAAGAIAEAQSDHRN